MNNKDKRLLRRYVATLIVTPYRRLEIIYLTLKEIYLTKYLNVLYSQTYEYEIDKELSDTFANEFRKLEKTDFLYVYAGTCKVYAKRFQKCH